MDKDTEQTNDEIRKLAEEVEKLKQEIIRLHAISDIKNDSYSSIPVNCRNCSNHPSNGGSGICHCILGSQVGY